MRTEQPATTPQLLALAQSLLAPQSALTVLRLADFDADHAAAWSELGLAIADADRLEQDTGRQPLTLVLVRPGQDLGEWAHLRELSRTASRRVLAVTSQRDRAGYFMGDVVLHLSRTETGWQAQVVKHRHAELVDGVVRRGAIGFCAVAGQ